MNEATSNTRPNLSSPLPSGGTECCGSECACAHSDSATKTCLGQGCGLQGGEGRGGVSGDAPPAYQQNGHPVSATAFYAVACDPRRSVAVEACAGAGKTWMLVSRIVRALLDGMDPVTGALSVQPHEILAITFTKRAAGEMRERLYQWLQDFAQADEAQLLHELEIRGVDIKKGSLPSSVLAGQLSKLYAAVLACARGVQLRTFHSWFAALLRTAPLALLQQLGLPTQYELLEDDAQAVALVWRRFFAALVQAPGLRADFDAVVLRYGRSQTLKALTSALAKRTEFSLALSAGTVQRSVKPFGELLPALAGLAAPQDALGSDAARQRWLSRAQALGVEKNKTPQKAAQMVVQAFETADLSARAALLRKAFFVADEDRLTQHLQKFDAALEAQAELVPLCAALHQHEAWGYQQRMTRLSACLLQEFAALKRAHAWVDMSDVERAALVLLSDPQLAGWVQQRLDAQVRHLLIDEFQDTNPLQWQALSAWLGSYAGAAGSVPSVFLVGDPKQSIYRFRRAEPQVFVAAQAFVREGLGGDVLACDHTRRNAAHIIDTVNTVMAQASAQDGYPGFRAHTTDSQQPGQVLALPPIARDSLGKYTTDDAADDTPNDTPDPQVWRDSLTTPRLLPEVGLRTQEAEQAATWIAQALQASAHTPEPLQPSDVMVLSRRRAGLSPMQDALRQAGIAAQVGEKTQLIECCEVQDLVALLDVLVSPGHNLSLARALKSPLFACRDEDLVALALLAQAEPVPWFELLPKTQLLDHKGRGLHTVFMLWQRWLAELAPHDALQAIYSDADVLARFAACAPVAARARVVANLEALLGLSLQTAGGRFITPYAFVRALKAGGVQAPAVPDAQAVRLLTVHGAKGLEARLVLLLDTDTAPRAADTMSVLVDWPGEAAAPRRFIFLASESQPSTCAQDLLATEHAEQQREELNALYVAMTRARQTLVVSRIAPHREAQQSWFKRLQPLADEVATIVAAESVSTVRAEPVEALRQARECAPSPHAVLYLKSLTNEPLDLVNPEFSAIKLEEVERASEGEAEAESEPALDAAPAADTVAARVGQAMHRLLEWGALSDANVRSAAREFELNDAQAERARRMAAQILQGEGAWAWDASQLQWAGNEVELMVDGDLLRLDRLVQRRSAGQADSARQLADAAPAGPWWVLDYKSASAPQEQPELVAQLRRYRDAVQRIDATQTVRCAFLTPQGRLIEVA